MHETSRVSALRQATSKIGPYETRRAALTGKRSRDVEGQLLRYETSKGSPSGVRVVKGRAVKILTLKIGPSYTRLRGLAPLETRLEGRPHSGKLHRRLALLRNETSKVDPSQASD